ncbi:IP6K2 kinase, partial [Anhinga anhinga]|nr:IP6K2 kinase [Anhinga anhinga]
MSPAFGAMEVEHYSKGVLLEPFVHQVGGHSCVLRFNDKTICKPLIQREHQFYETLPTEMRKFTPQYEGKLPNRRMGLGFFPSVNTSVLCSLLSLKSLLCGRDFRVFFSCILMLSEAGCGDAGWKCLPSCHKLEEEFEWLKKSEVLYYTVEKKGNVSSQFKHHNPWSMKCHQQQLQRMKENAKHRNQYKFILLENLTSRYEVPCVLDLKMGTRQHGDDASEEKKANQIRKCQQSTSAVIGVRVCGMQVYQAGTGQLMFMNKYHGRKLSVQGFKEALYQFFHNGKYLRRELFESVIKKLTELKSVLEKQESYRFYSSSLLIIYDGKERQEVAVDSDPEDLEDLSEESSDESAGAYAYKPTASTVDVRMIDFAHTTCKYYGEDSVVHEGQDTGYVFGLQNLIDIIKEIRDESSE